MYLVPTPQRFFCVEPTVGHRANVAKWRQRRHFAAFALSCIGVKHGDFLFRFFCRNAGNFLPFCAPAATTAVQNSGERTANYFAIFVAQLRHAFDKLAAQNTHEVRTYTNFTFVSFVVRSAMLKKPRNGGNFRDGNFRDRMCNCNTVTRDAITIAIWSGLHPDTLLV